MSSNIWHFDSLWAKSKRCFERAFQSRGEDDLFGLWCSFGLELLARAAVASVSPVLLAEPDTNHANILFALGRSKSGKEKSLGTAQVLALCRNLFASFREEEFKAALALVNQRNAELHSGAAAFLDYPPSAWLPGLYGVCSCLCEAAGRSMNELFGEEEAAYALSVIEDTKADVRHHVQNRIASHRNVFLAKDEVTRESLKRASEDAGDRLAYERHHRVTCPACGCIGLVQGEPVGAQKRTVSTDDEVITEQAISPRIYSCEACGLRLNGYAELSAAGLGADYLRKTTATPEEHFGLVDPIYIDPTDYGWIDPKQEYDNE